MPLPVVCRICKGWANRAPSAMAWLALVFSDVLVMEGNCWVEVLLLLLRWGMQVGPGFYRAWSQRLKLLVKYDEPLSNFAFYFKLCCPSAWRRSSTPQMRSYSGCTLAGWCIRLNHVLIAPDCRSCDCRNSLNHFQTFLSTAWCGLNPVAKRFVSALEATS